MGVTTGDEEQLAISIIAKLGDLEKQMAKANGITARAFREMTLTTKRATRQMEQDAARSAERINAAMATVGTRIGVVGRNFATAAAAAFSAEKLVAASQAYVRASNALKVAGLSGAALTDTFGKLYAVAQENGAPIETLVGLYSKAAQVQTALGASSSQLISFTTTVAQSLRVSGTSAEEAQGALLQMGQALGSGTVHAEEYNSMLEGAYPVLQAAAAGIKEAGGEVSKLTQLVKAGEVSSKAFFYGVLAGAPTLADKLAGSTETLSQAWTKFENALTKAVGEMDAATGVTGNLAAGLGSLIPWLEKLPGAIDLASEKWAKFKGAVNDAAGAFNHFMGYDSKEAMAAAGLVPIDEARAAAAKEALAKAAKNPNSTGGGFGGEAGNADKRVADAFSLLDKPKATVTPVSLKDYPADAKKKSTGTGTADTENEYERAIRKTQEHTAALQAEAAAVGKNAEEKARAVERQRLLTAAKQSDTALTPAVLAQIDQESGAYARAAAELDRLEQAQRRAIQAADGFRDATKDVMSGFISDLREGKSGAEALAAALNKIENKIADKLVSDLVDSLLGKSGSLGGGMLGSLLSLFGFANGGAFVGGVQAFASGGAFSNSIVSTPTLFRFASGAGLMGEAGPEAIMPLSRDKNGKLGVSMAAPLMVGAGGTSSNSYSPTIHVNTMGSTGNPTDDRHHANMMKRELRSMLDAHASEWFTRQSQAGGLVHQTSGNMGGLKA